MDLKEKLKQYDIAYLKMFVKTLIECREEMTEVLNLTQMIIGEKENGK